MIEEMPQNVLVDYVEMRLVLRNGVLFGAHRLAAKMGWSLRKTYAVIAAQKHHGLMYKDRFGHYVQVKSKDAIAKYATKKKFGGPTTHKTTLPLKRNSTRDEIRDWLKYKLAERGGKQCQWASTQASVFNTSHCLRSKIIRKGFNERNIWVAPEDHPAIPMLELGAGEVSMTVKELARITMQSERSTYRWKKRMRGRGMKQRNREALMPANVSLSLDQDPEWASVMSDAWKGTLVRYAAGWKLILPNAYAFTTTYSAPVRKQPVSKYKMVLDELKRYEELTHLYATKREEEGVWMREALANPW